MLVPDANVKRKLMLVTNIDVTSLLSNLFGVESPNLVKGLNYYKSLMPNSTEDQIVLERTANYYRLPVVQIVFVISIERLK